MKRERSPSPNEQEQETPRKRININEMKSVGTQTDIPETYHMLYEMKRKQETDYKGRCERTRGKDRRLERVADCLEAFLCFAEAAYHQHKAYKAGYPYAAFMNPDTYFENVYRCLKGQPPHLIGMFKYLHATTIKLYYDRERERCIQLLEEYHETFLKKLGEDPSGGIEIQEEYDGRIDSITEELNFCNEKIYNLVLLFEAAKEYTGNQDLDIDNSLEARIYAQDQLNSWRIKKEVKPVAF
ncbi:hypothetical protein Glove_498g26 [Diversispora epigaea]|uniref:Uncharacterized protein n=1 Tax=Diversispora epigaea TaxID=1348612 RepID=A0A397GN69_9GLOM|nr:hypothetical protein Glove_498g26 [Diversispora epigaea]